jgi:hypothetical protein
MAVCCESSVDGKNVSKVATWIITPKLLRKACSLHVKAGREYAIRRGIPRRGEVVAGTRTIHAFGGHRADRLQKR